MSAARGWVDSWAWAGSALAVLVLGCSTSRSAEREDSFAQQGESRREEGPWTRETWEWEARAGGRGAPETAYPPSAAVRPQDLPDSNRAILKSKSILPAGPTIRYTLETHASVVSTSTTTVEASGEAKEARSARFGFSPWQWAIGGLVALAGLYGLFRLKGKLGL